MPPGVGAIRAGGASVELFALLPAQDTADDGNLPAGSQGSYAGPAGPAA